MPYTVRLQKFEGPLELLLFLIRKNEVDIFDIPIAEITAQYLQYLDLMRYLDIDVAGEFILMAARLMHIKAQMLLPRSEEVDEEQEDPRTELVQRLLEYQKYKLIAVELSAIEERARDFFPRTAFSIDGDGYSDEELNGHEVSLYDLVAAFSVVLERASQVTYHEIREAEASVEEQITYVLDYLRTHGEALFADLIRGLSSKLVIIATFLALLELIRVGAVVVRQSAPFGEIWIYRV
ncbi:MAG: segregation/condensation protein A [candidate division KSB1 bacterium]|nr:segregation/condensation protein A [candidate division KSB1 bacterium]MDZ7294087.1 segregation/condensation protein A [candidate division KSB1 bacterium]MDZ7378702.1 segregation/condensation protein A [candidate division KSB1 bacterium]MDZ7393521.1 segregation/condensation protein A [candidate division KSB1 bacterium]MDZ7413378.1 segregation/condensation protein A [candidate division KSB1 bacterium]